MPATKTKCAVLATASMPMTDAFFANRIYRRLATALRQKQNAANKGGSHGRCSAALIQLAVGDIAVITCDKNEQYVLITDILSTLFKQSGRYMVEGMRCTIEGTWLEGGQNHYHYTYVLPHSVLSANF